MEKIKKLLFIATVVMLLTATSPYVSSTQLNTANDLGIEPLIQRKDTPMLCLDGCSLNGKHAWDVVHDTKSVDEVLSCGHCRRYCGFAAIAMINRYYNGNISQDRTAYFRNTSPDMGGPYLDHPEEDLLHAGLGSGGEATKTLSWALNNAEIYYYDAKPPIEQIREWINENRPILTLVPAAPLHFTVIDGVDDSYVHLIDPGYGSESRILYDELDVIRVWVPPTDATGRSDEPEIWQDSDSDGIYDFDEINRFFTDPYSNDTDNDGILDKIEIQSYTFINGTYDEEDIRVPDTDGDGLRNELDVDSDGGGTPDGLEDLNRDGVFNPELNETDPFNPDDDPPYLIGDINGDGIVDIFDVVLAAIAFGSKPGDDNWNPDADLNDDDIVDIFDIVILANNFGS